MSYRTILNLLPCLLLLSAGLQAQEADATEMKLREALRDTVLQMRTLQAEHAQLQADHARSQAEVARLSAAMEKLTKQTAEDQAAARKSEQTLTDKNEVLQAEVERLSESLKKWKEGYEKAADIARTKEAERAELADEASILRARVRDQKATNVQLHKLALEILDRYEGYSTGKALLAREPFTGITRARLESLITGYRDQIEDRRIKPEPSND